MASMNRVFLLGNLTRDVEPLRYTPSNKAVTDFGLAVNRKYRAANGEDREETCFVSVVVWDRQAENCQKYLKKGSQVLVEGRLQYDEWERDGKKQSRLRVVADRVHFLGSPKGGESRPARDAERGDAEGGPESDEPAGAPESKASPEPAGHGDEENLPF